MELEDCAFPNLHGVVETDDPKVAFEGADVAFLVGSRPRTKGMERKDLLEANGAIFTVQGEALAASAKPDVKVLVVGNPANTNCLIAMENASGARPQAVHGDDPPRPQPGEGTARSESGNARVRGQEHDHLGQPLGDAVPRRVPRGSAGSSPGVDAIGNDQSWIENEFIPTVQQRGAKIIEARGSSSAASAANAAVDHMRDWLFGTPGDEWVSMGVPSDGSYGDPRRRHLQLPVHLS